MAGKIGVTEARVEENVLVALGIFLLKLEGRYTATPGQFYMLRAWGLDPLLSRPLSLFDLDESGISFLYAVRGRGTDLLSHLSPGDAVGITGPLGNGWPRRDGRIALVGGGIGIAPLYYAAKALHDANSYLGFANEPYLVNEFERVSKRVYVTSETGAGVTRGRVTDTFDPDGYDACYACGPRPMLAVLDRICGRGGVPLYVSLEERMACGVGACLGCVVRTVHGYARVCRDGPVFPSSEVMWNG